MKKTKICWNCKSSFVPMENEESCPQCNHNKINEAMEKFEMRNKKNKESLTNVRR